MNIHVYLMCFQSEALVASHLPAAAFGAYMAVGTQKHTAGNLMFFEIDTSVDSDFIQKLRVNEQCMPHQDGSPRRSKYLSIYRVLEHVPLRAFGTLYLVTRDGRTLALESAPYEDTADSKNAYLYTELAPVTPRVVSNLNPHTFGRFITDPSQPVSVPRILFCDSLFEQEADGTLAGYLPYANPEHIVDCVDSLKQRASKVTKTVERNPRLIAFYRTIGKGFYLADQSGMKYYPFPSKEKLEDEHHLWWRSASLD